MNAARARRLAILVLVWGGSAFAASRAEKEARAHVTSSQEAYNLGKFELALNELEAAYKLKPVPGLLFNFGQCHRQLRNYERAAFYFKAYVDSGLEGPQVEVARSLADEMTAKQTELVAEQAKAAQLQREREEAETKRNVDLELARLKQKTALGSGPQVTPDPVYKKWWFWTGIAVLAAAGTTTYLVTAPQPRATSLGQVNLR